MRAIVTVVLPARGTSTDVRIDAPASTPVADVVRQVAALVGGDADSPATVDGARMCGSDRLGSSAVRDGAVITLGVSQDGPPSPPDGLLELRVVGGPAAGARYALRHGTVTVGRGGSTEVDLDDPTVSRRHAVLAVGPDGATVADLDSANGTAVETTAVGSGPVAVRPGQTISVGRSTLELSTPATVRATVIAGGHGQVAYNRPPRIRPARESWHVDMPQLPAPSRPPRLPVLATLAPLAVGIVLAAAMRRPEYLLFTLLSPVMVGGQWLSDRFGQRKADRQAQGAYERALDGARARIAEAAAAETRARRASAPDAATVSATALGPTTRLWERRAADPDFLVLRLGLADQRARFEVTGPHGVSPILHAVPVVVDLREIGVLGIAGETPVTAASARFLVAQAAVLCSPRDLTIVLLRDPVRPVGGELEWVRWLPHVRAPSGLRCEALVGTCPTTVAARIDELVEMVRGRRAATAGRPTRYPATLVVVGGSRELRRVSGMAEVLADGPAVGVFSICLDIEESDLPAECGAVAAVSHSGGDLRLNVAGAEQIDGVADTVTAAWAERIARALAPLRDSTPDHGADDLPAAARWLDLASVRRAAQSAEEVGAAACDVISAAWRRGPTTRGLIGKARDGDAYVDLSADGPHVLVAGTTGSGKSELLQTLVASLAAANRPDDLAFVLVDYKGGAAFGACAQLPHTVGLVTDLDGALVERAIVSLTAELKRRESLLGRVGATDIGAYQRAGHRLNRLVIVVDEFAGLAEELPQFVGGLVGIAQRGRSLGVHLVLATQRPGGVVSADIRANTNLRICLAVTQEADSRDVIDAPDAAHISRHTPGRAYIRTGHGELTDVQIAWVGGPAAIAATGITVALAPFDDAGRITDKGARDRARNGPTELDVLVEACRQVAARADTDRVPAPWLAPLPNVATLPAVSEGAAAVVGIHDLPAEQSQQPLTLDVAEAGNVLIAGTARSGRTTALRTIAVSLAASTPVPGMHLYVIDGLAGGLACLADLPHCGAVVPTGDRDRLRRMLALLTRELTRRHDDRTCPIGDPDGPPRIVLLLDGWESFLAATDDPDGGGLLDDVFHLLRDGPSRGIHLVVAADRAGLGGRLGAATATKFVLRLADRGDFALAGIPASAVPATMPPGRVLRTDGTAAQLYVVGDDPKPAAQCAAVARHARRLREGAVQLSPSAWPRRIEPWPDRVCLAALPSPSDPGTTTPGDARVVIGIGGDELRPVTVDLTELGPGFVLAGPPRSGRSTALVTIACGLRRLGWRLVAVTPRRSPLRTAPDGTLDALVHDPDDGVAGALLDDLAGGPVPLAVFVDDAELLNDTAVGSVLDRFMPRARDAGHLVIVAGTTDELALGFRGFAVEARRSRCGLLLAPRGPLDGELLGVRLPRRTAKTLPAGRGLLAVHGTALAIQVACAT